eukprot:Rhum_TRINITY_DN5261_c0_g1::Rhum_TRINITY_DN5261_c0_g1_i1::g.16952::m.16952
MLGIDTAPTHVSGRPAGRRNPLGGGELPLRAPGLSAWASPAWARATASPVSYADRNSAVFSPRVPMVAEGCYVGGGYWKNSPPPTLPPDFACLSPVSPSVPPALPAAAAAGTAGAAAPLTLVPTVRQSTLQHRSPRQAAAVPPPPPSRRFDRVGGGGGATTPAAAGSAAVSPLHPSSPRWSEHALIDWDGAWETGLSISKKDKDLSSPADPRATRSI